MDYLNEKCDLDKPWMEKSQQIRYNIGQQKNLFDAAFCAVKELMGVGFDRVGVWTYTVGNDAASNLFGVDDYGKIYSNPEEHLPSESIPSIYEYVIEIDSSIIKEKLGIDGTIALLQKDKDEGIFNNIWGYYPPYPGYYKRDAKGDNICLRTSEERGKILLISVDNFISGRTIDHTSAMFLHLVLIEMEKFLINLSLKEAIVQSESKNRAILDAIPDLMFRITKDGVIIDYKDADQKEFYVSKEKIIGSNIRDVLPLDIANQTQEYILKALDSGTMQIYEYKLPVPKGTRDYESRMVVCGKDEVLAIIRDITEHKQMEERLQSSEERLKRIFEYAPDAYYLYDSKGVFVDGNKNAEKMIGYEKNELIGKSFLNLKLLPVSQMPKAAALLYKNVMGHATGPDEFTLISKDGEKIPIEIRTVPIEIDGQELVLGIARDISERIKIEEQLRKSEEKYRLIFELSPEVILILDKKGNIQDINEKTYDWIGYKSEEFIGKNILKLPFMTKKSKLLAMQNFFQRLTGKEIKPYELEFIAKDKKTHIIGRVMANPIKDENGKIVQDLVMISNITDQKIAENALQKAHNELEKRVKERTIELTEINEELKLEITKRKQIENVLMDREKTLEQQLEVEERITKELEAKTNELSRSNIELNSFVYTVSHDLKAPVVSLQGFSSLLMSNYGDKIDETGKLYITRIQKNSERMGTLIENLLELSRIGRIKGQEQAINISSIISDVTNDLGSLLENRGTKIIVKGEMPTLYCDRIRIIQIFSNLISNANKFMGDDNKNPMIEVGYNNKNGDHVFYVKDNGIGIDKDYHEKIFQVFQRLGDIETEGTGVGLAIVKKIIENIRGKIWVDSAKGQGTTMYFTIPNK